MDVQEYIDQICKASNGAINASGVKTYLFDLNLIHKKQKYWIDSLPIQRRIKVFHAFEKLFEWLVSQPERGILFIEKSTYKTFSMAQFARQIDACLKSVPSYFTFTESSFYKAKHWRNLLQKNIIPDDPNNTSEIKKEDLKTELEYSIQRGAKTGELINITDKKMEKYFGKGQTIHVRITNRLKNFEDDEVADPG
jgi:hypothetical protein